MIEHVFWCIGTISGIFLYGFVLSLAFFGGGGMGASNKEDLDFCWVGIKISAWGALITGIIALVAFLIRKFLIL